MYCRLFTSFAALALAAGPLAAADPPARLPGGVRAAVEVTALDLDVVATKDGKFVPDLGREEFVVKVDGKAVPLDYFTRVEEGTLFGPDLSKASPDLILDSIRDDAGGRYLARQYLVYFDDEHLQPFDRPRAIEGLRDLFYKLAPSDQVGIVRYDRGTTRALVPFTTSKEELLDGLAKLEKLPPGGLSWRSQSQTDWASARSSRYAYERQNIIRNYSAQALVREQAALKDLRRAISALAARSGKRTMIYVGAGIELHPGQAFAQAFSPGLQQFEYDVTPDYLAVLREANESGVTIYSIDARGLTTDVDAGEQSPFELSPFEVRMIRREVLAGLAEETGGVLFENRNAFKGAVEQIYRESSTFYSIGVTLSNLPKKEEHSISVSVTRPGVKIRTRSKFVPKSADKASRDHIEMALLTPETKGDFDVPVSVGAPRPGGMGRRLSTLEVRIPLGALTFKEAAGRPEAAVDVTIAAVEDNGARSDPSRPQRVTIPLVRGKDFYVFSSDLKTRTGNHRFVVTVKDVATNRVGFGSASIRIE
jgi:VWFA-related protein